jgi:hypothetical protein
MDPLERMALEVRQAQLGADAQRHIESALAHVGTYSELLEQGYFLGATAVSLLAAGHTHLAQRATPVAANSWLKEQLRGLGAILSDGSAQAVTISVSVKPKT